MQILLSAYTYHINKSSKERCMFRCHDLLFFGRRVFANVVAKQNVSLLSKRDCVVSIISYSRK